MREYQSYGGFPVGQDFLPGDMGWRRQSSLLCFKEQTEDQEGSSTGTAACSSPEFESVDKVYTETTAENGSNNEVDLKGWDCRGACN